MLNGLRRRCQSQSVIDAFKSKIGLVDEHRRRAPRRSTAQQVDSIWSVDAGETCVGAFGGGVGFSWPVSH